MFRANMTVNTEAGRNAIFIQEESVEAPAGFEWVRDRGGTCFTKKGDEKENLRQRFEPGESVMPRDLRDVIGKWQFLSLLPDPMGRPAIKRMASNGTEVLNRDGSNLAQYLLNIRTKDTAAFDSIVEAIRFVLDYARNVEPVETREIQPTMYLKMLEQLRDESIEIPGWLISTGTIRILALLAVLRNPDPPPLLVVEEIENGLDPRSLNLVLEEIRTAVEAGDTQVILTTHSPYFLDLLDLSHLVLCERVDGVPVFKRTSDMKTAREWAKSFAPGRLYVMDRLHVEDQS
jgi:predicted ATPase